VNKDIPRGGGGSLCPLPPCVRDALVVEKIPSCFEDRVCAAHWAHKNERCWGEAGATRGEGGWSYVWQEHQAYSHGEIVLECSEPLSETVLATLPLVRAVLCFCAQSGRCRGWLLPSHGGEAEIPKQMQVDSTSVSVSLFR